MKMRKVVMGKWIALCILRGFAKKPKFEKLPNDLINQIKFGPIQVFLRNYFNDLAIISTVPTLLCSHYKTYIVKSATR